MYFSSVSSRLLLHDINTWELKRSYGCYEGLLRDISWSDDAKYLLQVNPKGLVEILVTSEITVRCRQHIPLRETWSACFHREGHHNVAIGTRSGNVLIWNIKNKSVTKTFPTSQQNVPVNFVCYDAKNANLAANQLNGDTTIYGLTQNMPLMTIKLASSKHITAMKYHYECRSTLGFATEEGHLILRDIVTNADISNFANAHAGQVTDFLFSPSLKDVVVSCGMDKQMNIYDSRYRNVIASTRYPYSLTTLASKPNNENQIALGTINGSILIYDLRDLETPLQLLKGHKERVNKVCFQPFKNKTIATEIDCSDQHIPQRLVDSPIRSNSPNDRQFKDYEKNLILKGLDPVSNSPKQLRSQVSRTSANVKNDKRDLNMEQKRSKMPFPLLSKLPNTYPVLHKELSHSKEFATIDRCLLVDSPISETVNTPSVDELKQYLTKSLAEVRVDNRNYFLNVMMLLSKQKLELDKQLTTVTSVLKSLMANQALLTENNRLLNMELEQLKAQKIPIN